jgi:hypothetical protein
LNLTSPSRSFVGKLDLVLSRVEAGQPIRIVI